MDASELREQLKRHLGFLQRSVQSYDEGHVDEAIRMAVSMRVLFHDTGNSTSLMTLMQADDVHLLSTVIDIDDSYLTSCSNLSIACTRFDNTSGDMVVTTWFRPRLDETGPRSFKPWNAWWNQVVMLKGGVSVSRRAIVLAAANKDGGTHVETVPAFYKALMEGGGHTFAVGNGPDVKLAGMNLCDLRQLAHEVLSSNDLHALV